MTPAVITTAAAIGTLAATLMGVGCQGARRDGPSPAKPTTAALDFRFKATPLEGTPVEGEQVFEIWRVIKPGDEASRDAAIQADQAARAGSSAPAAVPAPAAAANPSGPAPQQIRLGTLVRRVHRNRNERLTCEERKTVYQRGPSVISVWRKVVFVEDEAGQPLRFSVQEMQTPGKAGQSYFGTFREGKLRLTLGNDTGGSGRPVSVIDPPANFVTPTAVRRQLLATDFTTALPGQILVEAPVVFPIFEDPDKPHAMVAGLVRRDTVTFAGRDIPVWGTALITRDVFGANLGRIEYINAQGEIFRIEETSGQDRIEFRRVK